MTLAIVLFAVLVVALVILVRAHSRPVSALDEQLSAVDAAIDAPAPVVPVVGRVAA